jgi:hypothetical protein
VYDTPTLTFESPSSGVTRRLWRIGTAVDSAV